jgi:flavin prenyltransferase
MRKIIIAIGGSSGSIYAKLLLDKLCLIGKDKIRVGIVMSNNAKINWKIELGDESYTNYPFDYYEKMDFNAPFASGSAQYDTMIICPSSMGLLSRIAHGLSNDLTTRAADVILKERRKLIIVPREMPYNLIHIKNMELITQAGGIICPAVPSFYHNPKTLEEICMTVVDRVLDLASIENKSKRWNDN